MNYIRKHNGAFAESTCLMATLTAIGGFLDAYTYCVRGGVMANNQTTNMVKLGMIFFDHKWETLTTFIPLILACVLGSAVSTYFIAHYKGKGLPHWKQTVLLVELAGLLIAGFLPTTIPHIFTNTLISFCAGLQLATFRKWKGVAHNTTISTGNLRSVGQNLGEFFYRHDAASLRSLVSYTGMALSFCLGALLGACGSHYLGQYAVWACCAALAFLSFTLWQESKL